jgi:hypothetical protein
MKLLVFIATILLSIMNSHSQDSTWIKKVVDENLTLSFPGRISEIDTSFIQEGKRMSFRIFKHESESGTLALIVTPNNTNANIDNQETLQKALDEMANGSLQAMKESGLSCQSEDSTIDNIRCKKIVCKNGLLSTVENYIFLVNDKMYSFQSATFGLYTPGTQSSDLNKFLNSIRFEKTSIKEQRFESRAESIGYKIGRLTIPLLIIVGVIFYVVRKL